MVDASSTAPLPAPRGNPIADRVALVRAWADAHREAAGWLGAAAIILGVAYWIFRVQYEYVLGPGTDAGNWIAISYAYMGQYYPGQVNPYGYPPMVFPLVALIVRATGGAVTASHVVVAVLVVLLGLSTYALARAMLRSITLSLAALGFLLLNPYFMVMFSWGAWPNVFAFVFLNLALVGLIWTGRGRRAGPYMFWFSAAATVLTHSLVAVELAGLVAVLLVLALFVPYRGPTVEGKKVDDPGRIAPSLLFTGRGLLGMLVFSLAVGGYYLATYLVGVPHPGYLGQASSGTVISSFGLFFRNVLPGLNFPAVEAYYVVAACAVLLSVAYLVVARARPLWISTPLLVALCSWLSVLLLGVIGWNLHIITDYHRFAFLLIIPGILALAYLIDRGWLGAVPARRPRLPAERGALSLEERVARWRPSFPTRRRHEIVGVTSAGLAIFLAVTVTAPGFQLNERQFAGTSHDTAFLEALQSIHNSSLPGSVLTVSANLKWTWAVTHRNAYAPRPGSAYLFYPAQVRDSALSYYALTTDYALTNGYVAAGVRSTDPTLLSGIPDFMIYQAGSLVPALRINPLLVDVTLLNRSDGLPYMLPLATSPSIIPAPSPGAPALIQYAGPGFLLTQAITLAPNAPAMFVNVTATATGTDPLLGVNEVLSTPNALTATVVPGALPGTFSWAARAVKYVGLPTQGFVSPANGLQGVTMYYPPSGGPAVVLDFTSNLTGGSRALSGSLELFTPLAKSLSTTIPWQIQTQQVWANLGIRFILFPNKPVMTVYPGAVVTNEALFLTKEFGCTVYYINSEWIVFEVPTPAA
jgi:hypothetical protein